MERHFISKRKKTRNSNYKKEQNSQNEELEKIKKATPEMHILNKHRKLRTIIHPIKNKINYFKAISDNLIGYLSDFFSIFDVFNIIKLNKRIKNTILKRHKLFLLYINSKKIQFYSFENLFKQNIDSPNRYSDLDVFNAYLKGDNLNKNETENLLQDFFYSITKIDSIGYEDIGDNLMKYYRIFLSHPKCPVSYFSFTAKPNFIYSDLKYLIASNQSINVLTIIDFVYSEDNVNQLITHQQDNPNLKILNIELNFENRNLIIEDMNTYNKNIRLFLNLFNKNLTIEDLRLNCLEGNDKTGLILSDFIKYNKTIKSLSLTNFDFRNINIFNDSLRHNDKINLLNVECATFDTICLEKLLNNLVFSNVKHVSFKGCELEENELKMVVEFIENNKTIELLNIDRNKLSIEGLTSVSEMIKHNKSLKILGLSQLITTAENLYNFDVIFEALTLNNTLETIDLTFNPKCNCSEDVMFKLLSVNKTLKEFLVVGTGLKLNVKNLIRTAMFLRQSDYNAR